MRRCWSNDKWIKSVRMLPILTYAGIRDSTLGADSMLGLPLAPLLVFHFVLSGIGLGYLLFVPSGSCIRSCGSNSDMMWEMSPAPLLSRLVRYSFWITLFAIKFILALIIFRAMFEAHGGVANCIAGTWISVRAITDLLQHRVGLWFPFVVCSSSEMDIIYAYTCQMHPNAMICHDTLWNAQDAAVEGNQLTFHFLHYLKQGPLVYDLCSLHLRYTALVYFAVLHFGRRHRNGPARMSLFHHGPWRILWRSCQNVSLARCLWEWDFKIKMRLFPIQYKICNTSENWHNNIIISLYFITYIIVIMLILFSLKIHFFWTRLSQTHKTRSFQVLPYSFAGSESRVGAEQVAKSIETRD